MDITINKQTVPSKMVKVSQKSDIDKINAAFDCHQSDAVPDETILDLTCADESEEMIANLVELFGEDNTADLVGHIVIFHG